MDPEIKEKLYSHYEIPMVKVEKYNYMEQSLPKVYNTPLTEKGIKKVHLVIYSIHSQAKIKIPAGQQKLAKVNTKGMKSIASFFKKKQ